MAQRADKRPARSRYWSSGRLKAKKVRNLLKYNGNRFNGKAEAEEHWESVRKRHH